MKLTRGHNAGGHRSSVGAPSLDVAAGCAKEVAPSLGQARYVALGTHCAVKADPLQQLALAHDVVEVRAGGPLNCELNILTIIWMNY